MAVRPSNRTTRRIVILLVIVTLVVVGGYYGHRYRKSALARDALEKGNQAYAEGRFGVAATHLGKYLATDSRSVDVLLKYADAQVRRRPEAKGSIQQAINALENVLRDQPAHRVAAERLSDLYVALGAKNDAERIARAWMNAAAGDPPARSEASRRLVAALLSQQKPDEALVVVQKWIQEAPKDPAAYRAQADIVSTQNKPDEAVAALQNAVSLDPGDAPTASRLALLLVGTKQDRASAEKIMDELLARSSRPADARVARGRFYLLLHLGQPLTSKEEQETTRQDREKAIREFEAALALNPTTGNTLLDLGLLFSQLGLGAQASSALEQAHKIDPKNSMVYVVQGQIALDAADPAVCQAVADRAVAAPLGEERWDLLPMAAELYAVARRPQEAGKLLAELRSGDAPSETLQYIEALIAVAENRTTDAAARLLEVVRREPKFARAQLLLGRVSARTGDLRRAVEALQAYIQLEQATGRPAAVAVVQMELAGLLVQLRRWDEAVRVLDETNIRLPQAQIANRLTLSQIELRARIARFRDEKPQLDELARTEQMLAKAAAESPDAPALKILQAQVMAWRGGVDQAVALLNTLKGGPAASQAALALIDIYADARQFDKAIAECNQAIASADKDQAVALRARLAELQDSAGDPAAARKALEEAAAQASGPARTAARMRLARLLVDQQQEDAARDLLARMCVEEPASLPPRLMLLAFRPVAGKGPGRQELVEQVRKIEGEQGLNWRYWQAVTWLDAGELDKRRAEIEALLNACITADPAWDAPVVILGRLYEQTGRPAEAMTAYRRLLGLDRGNLAVARAFLRLAMNSNQWDEADRVLQGLPADEPSVREYRLAQALRSGDSARAAQMLEARIAADPNDFTARLRLAAMKVSGNDIAEAERRVAEAARIKPDAPEVFDARVQLHLLKREYEQALQLCDQMLAKAPSADAYQLRAQVHSTRGDVARAAEDLKALSRLPNGAERGYWLLGLLYQQNRQPDQAVRAWQEGLTAAPTSLLLRGSLADALLTGPDPALQEQGRRMLGELLGQYPNNQNLLRMQAADKYRRNPEEGRREYEQIIQRGLAENPRNLELLLLRAQLALEENPKVAALAAREALAVQPNSDQAALLLLQATDVEGGGNVDQGIEVLRQVLKAPGSERLVSARLALARLLVRKGDFKAADRLIEEARLLDSDNPAVVQTRLRWYRDQSQWDAIAALAGDRFNQRPDDMTSLQMAGLMLAQSDVPKQQEAGVALLRRLIERHPEDATGYSALALVVHTAGNVEEARKLYERSATLDPRNFNVLNNLTWITCEQAKDPAAARPWGEKALAAAPNDPHVLDTWGVLQYRLGNLEESRAALERCINAPGTPPGTRVTAMFHLARTLEKLDPAASRGLVDRLAGNPSWKRMLSPASLAELEALDKRLPAATQPADSRPTQAQLP